MNDVQRQTQYSYAVSYSGGLQLPQGLGEHERAPAMNWASLFRRTDTPGVRRARAGRDRGALLSLLVTVTALQSLLYLCLGSEPVLVLVAGREAPPFGDVVSRLSHESLTFFR